MEPNISRPDSKAQQSDCLISMSRAYIVRRMPAKVLSAEQLAEAAHLKALFKEWQAERKRNNQPWTQEAVSDEFGFGQSALSQYLGGDIPLNLSAVARFAEVLGVTPMDISPSIVRHAREMQAKAAALLASNKRGRATKPKRSAA